MKFGQYIGSHVNHWICCHQMSDC